ncbi:preprotein translocase subunit SecG [Candidatus Omnitrophota bacterium]
MFNFLLVFHAVACVLLVTIVLMQSGRGGGLTEAFSGGMESMFGAKTNTIMVRTTTALAVIFIVSCLALAYMSAKRSKSLMAGQLAVSEIEEVLDVAEETSVEEAAEVIDAEEQVEEVIEETEQVIPDAQEESATTPEEPKE